MRSIVDLLVGEGSFNATILVYRTFLIVGAYFSGALARSGFVVPRLNSRLLRYLGRADLIRRKLAVQYLGAYYSDALRNASIHCKLPYLEGRQTPKSHNKMRLFSRDYRLRRQRYVCA
jgi:hypothetical protein